MGNTTNLSELVSIVTEQTRIEKSIVEKFIKQLFIEIETSLLKNTAVKVISIGTFKVIKSGNTNKLLFLPDFKPYPRALPAGDINEKIHQELKPDIQGQDNETIITEDIQEVIEVIHEPEPVFTGETISIQPEIDSTSFPDIDFISEKKDEERERRKNNLVKISLVAVGVIILIAIIYFLGIKDSKTAQKDQIPIEKDIDYIPGTLRNVSTSKFTNLYSLYNS